MREISTLKHRILKYLETKGISRYEFYIATGISNGVLSQSNGLSEENLLRFLSAYHDIDLDWLFTGKGEMLRRTAEEQENKVKFSQRNSKPSAYDNRNELKMICELAAENALLKRENEELKGKLG
ncbi:MAG: hypothetical protein LKK19_01285 [Bacteroidales bacterium]|jgi:hypothetical protein|nr:hypothetical protein [Bacteroidales bacterium]MCI2121321.1 hypothetical protein [Bacteroidales bacterium]MCI2145929.1 hypothetical protein [Bacteroidales bacterium]